MRSRPTPDAPAIDVFDEAGRLAKELAYQLMAESIGTAELTPLVRTYSDADAVATEQRLEVERHEARLDGAAVTAGETLVRLRNAVDQLSDNRKQLVEGGLADDAMLEELDFQINTLQERIDEVKGEQSEANRAIEVDLTPQRDEHVASELARQQATVALVEGVLGLKPEPCPASLQPNFAKLAVLAGLL